jgi:hypothetical protein
MVARYSLFSMASLAFAASNEDWADTNTQIWFVPATKDNYLNRRDPGGSSSGKEGIECGGPPFAAPSTAAKLIACDTFGHVATHPGDSQPHHGWL